MKTLIVVSSITNAARGKSLLDSFGIKSQIRRTPSLQAQYGCGYAVEIYSDPNHASEIFSTHGIRIIAQLSD